MTGRNVALADPIDVLGRHVERADDGVQRVVDPLDDARVVPLVPRRIGPRSQLTRRCRLHEPAGVCNQRGDVVAHQDHRLPERVVVGLNRDGRRQVACGDGSGALGTLLERVLQALQLSSESADLVLANHAQLSRQVSNGESLDLVAERQQRTGHLSSNENHDQDEGQDDGASCHERGDPPLRADGSVGRLGRVRHAHDRQAISHGAAVALDATRVSRHGDNRPDFRSLLPPAREASDRTGSQHLAFELVELLLAARPNRIGRCHPKLGERTNPLQSGDQRFDVVDALSHRVVERPDQNRLPFVYAVVGRRGGQAARSGDED